MCEGEEIHRINKCISQHLQLFLTWLSGLPTCRCNIEISGLPTCRCATNVRHVFLIEPNKSQGCIAQCVAHTILTQILPTSNTCSVSYCGKALKQKGSYATAENPMHSPQMAQSRLTSDHSPSHSGPSLRSLPGWQLHSSQ